MIFDAPDAIVGIPLFIAVATDFGTSIAGICDINGNTFEQIAIAGGICIAPGNSSEFAVYSLGTISVTGILLDSPLWYNRLTYFQAIWGVNATQTAIRLEIQKPDLPGILAIASPGNAPTSLLVGIINNLLINFSSTASVPVEAKIFSKYVDGDYEYCEIIIKCKAKLSLANDSEIQYFADSFDPDNY